MSDYTPTTNFTNKDGLSEGDPEKIILGADIDAETAAIAAMSATKYDTGNLASQAQAEAGVDSATLMTPQRVEQAMDALLSGGNGVSLTSRVAALDISGLTNATPATGDEFAIYDATATAHRALTFDALGTALAGSGLTSSAGVLATDFSELTTETSLTTADLIVVRDVSGGHDANITRANLNGSLTLAALSDYDSNDHIDHTSVTMTAGSGLTGGGSIAATRTLTLGTGGTVSGSSSNAVTASSHTHALDANVYRGTLGSGAISAQSGGTASGGSNGDIILIY